MGPQPQEIDDPMAKATFQRNQRVWVESVGAWAVIERIDPVWAKGFEEPVKVTYDVGLGRPFHTHELRAEDPPEEEEQAGPNWRLMRARNKWQTAEECAHHPYPGTYPVVVTDAADWGGWRVPGAEYDLDPGRIEEQARLIANAPLLASFAVSLVDWARKSGEDMPNELAELAHRAQDLLTEVKRAS